jgi:hypothetical protein
MRTVLILLLLANVTLFAYTRLDTGGGGEPGRMAEQVDPAKIRILSPQQVAALGPLAAQDACLEWGPMSDADRDRALADLAPLNLGAALAQRRTEGDARAPNVLVVRDPPQSVVLRLKELQPGYPGAELRVATCARNG